MKRKLGGDVSVARVEHGEHGGAVVVDVHRNRRQPVAEARRQSLKDVDARVNLRQRGPRVGARELVVEVLLADEAEPDERSGERHPRVECDSERAGQRIRSDGAG